MIAKKAVELIHDGDMIFLDTSTTNIELAREIIERRLEVTVVSCMLDIAEVFTATKNVKFILLGGEFNRSQNGFLGELVLQMMENFRFDISFMGVPSSSVIVTSCLSLNFFMLLSLPMIFLHTAVILLVCLFYFFHEPYIVWLVCSIYEFCTCYNIPVPYGF